MSDVRKLAKIVAGHSRQIKGLSGGPQAAYSSIEGGSMDSYDSDGKLRLRIGAQDDGTQGVKYVQGPPPPRPTAPVVSVDGPVVRVRWDGILLGGHIPEDFSRIDVHFALDSDDLEDEAAVRGNLATSAGNETVLAATQTGTYRVGLVAMSQSRARSEMSEVVDVDVTLVDIEGALDAVVDNASGGSNHYSPEPPSGTDHDPDRDLWFDTSEDEEGLTHYTPHRWDTALQEWISLEDERTHAIQDAQDALEADIDSVRTSVDGKSRITQSVEAPPSQYDGAVGDRWERMSSMGSGGALISNWRWNGDAWVSTIISDAVLGNVDAAKIGTGYLDADRIEAGSVTADKILVGGAGNLLTNPGFTGGGTGWSIAWYNPIITDSGGPTGEPVLSIQGSSSMFPYLGGLAKSVAGSFAPDLAAVEAGKRYAASVWVRAEVDILVGNAGMAFRLRELGSADLGWAWPSTATNREVIPANTWAKVEGEFRVPETTGTWNRFAFGLRANGALSGQRVEFSAPVLLPKVGATLIEDGAVTTRHIETGSITAESGIIGSLDAGVITVGEMNGARIEAGTIDTPQLAFGAATGDVLSVDALNFKRAVGLDLSAPSIRVGDAMELTEDFGIRQFGPDGALNVSLPSDGSPAEFRGDLSARTLTATGRMSIQGPGAVASGGVLELESGVVPPVAGPQITNAWQRTTFPPVGERESPVGLAWADGHWWRAVQTTFSGEGATARLEKITTDGELVLSFPIEYRSQVNGITVLGDTIYVLGWPRGFGGGDRYVLGYDYAGNEVARWVYPNYGTGTYQPAIGNDGTNIVIVQSWADGQLTWRKFNPSTGATLSRIDADSRVTSDVAGIHFGDFDYGARRMVLTIRRKSGDRREQFLVYEDRAGAPAHRELPWFAANMDDPVGSDWVGGRFYSLGSDGHLYSYESHEGGRRIGDNEDGWWGAVSWATGRFMTTAGPATRFRYLHRAQLRVQNGDVPQGVELARFYTGKGATEPDRTGMHWVATFTQPHEPSRILSLPVYSTGINPSAQNTFTNDAPGEIRSAIGGFRVDGAGSGEWGSFNFHGDGSVTGKGTSLTGIVNHPPIPNGGNEHAVTVTFPAGRFTDPPVIVLTNSNGHLTPTVNRSSLTATSFQIRTWNFSTGNAGENITTWIAVED